MTDSTVEIQGKDLKLSNLEKVLYPATGFTKKDVIDYYVKIAPAMLPHLNGRALTRKRYPDGVDAEPFFEKNAPMHKPAWVKTAPIWSGSNRRTHPGVARHAINAPIRLPTMNEIAVASASRPIVHGSAWATMSWTVAGNAPSE